MLNRELFIDVSTGKNYDSVFLNSIVDLENNFQDYLDLTFEIISYIDTTRPEKCNENIKEFLKRLITLKATAISVKISNRIDYLLLQYTSEIMIYYNRTGHFHFCYPVITLGILDKTFANGEQIDINVFRVFKHIDSDDRDILNVSLETTIDWLGQFYYYSRSFSGLNDLGTLMIEETMAVIAENEINTAAYAFLISNVYSWCELNKLKTEINYLSKKINKLNNNLDNDSDVHYVESIKLEIILKNSFEIEDKKRMALDLGNHMWSDPISRAQFFIYVYANNLLPDFDLDKLNNEIALLTNGSLHNYKLDVIHEMSRFSKILNPFIEYCFEDNRYDDLNSVLGTFYQSTIVEKSILYLRPNSYEGSFLLSKNERFLNEFDVRSLIPELVKFQNLSLNQFTILKGRVYENVVPAKEIGMPEYKHRYGNQFESLLSQLYNFKLLVHAAENGLKSYFQFDYNSLPLQAVMIKSVEKVLPREVSFKHKNDFSKTTKVLFWKGNSFSSDIEFNCVKEIFEKHNIELVLSKPTKEDFLQQINKDFQIIWISSHGEHRHYAPFDSKIVLEDDIEIHLNEFESLANPFTNSRRLFFCNICEGGTMAQTGDLINVGFPAVLTDTNQDYLSHLWMIDFKFAMIYGAIFAIFIGEGFDYINAYNNTVLTLLNGKETILNKLKYYEEGIAVSDLIETINNMESYDFSNILYWGSSAYYV